MRKIEANILTIPGGVITGYLWLSDRRPDEVEVYDNVYREEVVLDASKNPFVVEGQLYDSSRNKSYSIKYADGLFRLTEYDMDEFAGEEECKINTRCYIASFDKAPGRLVFKQYWKEREDELCENMKVLCPADFVFVGFEKKNEL